MNELQQNTTELPKSEASCPSCSYGIVRTSPTEHRFAYGSEPDAVELTATVNLRRCESCGFEYLDDTAEDAKHDAICRHLGVIRPSDIRALRDRCGMTRAQFSQLTKIGEATLGRWERGALIQTAAYDQFLFLLGFQDNLERLSSRDNAEESSRTKVSQLRLVGHAAPKRFRVLQDEAALSDARQKAAKFRLRTKEAA